MAEATKTITQVIDTAADVHTRTVDCSHCVYDLFPHEEAAVQQIVASVHGVTLPHV